MIDTVVPIRRKLQRVGAEDFAFAEEALKTAELVIVPEDQTQRAAFEKLMPHLYVLRNKGCSWTQLTTLLNQSGFKLQPSTVRTYYSEMLVKCMDLCQARMNVQIDILKKLRDENAKQAGGDAELATLAHRVNTQLNKLQEKTSSRVNQLFGLEPAPSVVRPALPSPATAVETMQAAPAFNQPPVAAPTAKPATVRPPARTSAAVTETPVQEETTQPSNEFGLLGLGAAQTTATNPTGFFSLNDGPAEAPAAAPASARPAQAPVYRQDPLTPAPTPTAAASPQVDPYQSNPATPKQCAPLNVGIQPMKRRDKVPAEVYEPGLLEHPAIQGLMLTLEERLYGASLEYCDLAGDEAGIYRTETADEKRFRVTWRKVVPMTPTRTTNSFMTMDASLFKGRS